MQRIIKYPRTQHIKGSKLQDGDYDLSQIPFSKIQNKNIVIEEKVDGANVGISFSKEGQLLLQSRGHYLVGGYKERHYDLLKIFANENYQRLYNVLGDKYIMYGEWLYAKHKIYYDALPSYFLEFDVYDKQKGVFLDTPSRRELLKGLPIYSVPILASGKFDSLEKVLSYITTSNYKTENNKQNLLKTINDLTLNVDDCLKETDLSPLMEGLYIKVEENGVVVDRMKYVRYSFTQPDSVTSLKWLNKTIIPNKLL